jgi:hypothetical protein
VTRVASRRVAILEHAGAASSATGVRGRAIATFLRRCGHTVDIVQPTAEDMRRFARARRSWRARVARRWNRRATLPHMWDLIADWLEPRLRAGHYDVVIARSQDVGYVLTRRLASTAVYDMANIGFLEEYYSWSANLAEVEATFDRELELFEAVDWILSPHPLLTEYFSRHFDRNRKLASKVLTVRLGADLPERLATYAEEPRVVYAGSYYYIQDPYLLSELTRTSPVAIDCYGFRDPNRRFLPAPVNYRGYRETTEFLADYQFGLITVSRDALRQHSPATKFPYYFAYGLPVLFPDWMKEGYEYPDCAIPYSELTFAGQVAAASDRARWNAMSAAAAKRGRELSWNNVLKPLIEILA